MIDADGTYVVNLEGKYPKYLGIESIVVGYGHTRMGNCSGPACTLNDGRKPIKVGERLVFVLNETHFAL